MKIFIIIAAYNEARAIGNVIHELLPLNHTIVVVNDGSRDDTAAIARRSGATVLTHCMNLGQGAALQTGIEYARKRRADIIVTFDADGQHLVSDIASLLSALDNENVDIVLGSRFLGKKHYGMPVMRRMLLKLGVHYTNMTTELKLTDIHNGLRAFKVEPTRCIRLKQSRMAHASELLQQVAKFKLRYREVPCTILYSPYSLSKGQRLPQLVNVLADLLIGRLRK